MNDRDRARITIPDVIEVLVVLFFIGALWPVLRAGYAANSDIVPQGAGVLGLFILPLALLVTYFAVFRRTIRG
jgi:hypothetical protein